TPRSFVTLMSVAQPRAAEAIVSNRLALVATLVGCSSMLGSPELPAIRLRNPGEGVEDASGEVPWQIVNARPTPDCLHRLPSASLPEDHPQLTGFALGLPRVNGVRPTSL